jgi:integrase
MGAALNTVTDYREWKALLKAAGLREARLHDARHTGATVLLILGQPERTVMSLMGWSTTNMATHYQHVTDEIRVEVANQIDGLIWELLTDDRNDDIDMTDLTAALPDLRTALSEPNDTSGDVK